MSFCFNGRNFCSFNEGPLAILRPLALIYGVIAPYVQCAPFLISIMPLANPVTHFLCKWPLIKKCWSLRFCGSHPIIHPSFDIGFLLQDDRKPWIKYLDQQIYCILTTTFCWKISQIAKIQQFSRKVKKEGFDLHTDDDCCRYLGLRLMGNVQFLK